MRCKFAAGLLVLASAALSQGAIIEGFDDVASLPGQGWVLQNNSDSPGLPWRQGDGSMWGSYSGGPDSYVAADYQSTGAAVGTISNWILTPELSLDSNSVVSFFTRTVSSPGWPDRLQVRLSTSGSSTNVGSSPTDVGDFSVLLVDINPDYMADGYPNTWTQFQLPLDMLSEPVTGRIAFRYFVENGGSMGDNSNVIGVDSFSVGAVPEPSAGMALIGLSALTLVRRRRH